MTVRTPANPVTRDHKMLTARAFDSCFLFQERHHLPSTDVIGAERIELSTLWLKARSSTTELRPIKARSIEYKRR